MENEYLFTPKVPPTMGQDGSQLGARKLPSCLSLFCCSPCAISGYVTGDPTLGMCEGEALTALCLEMIGLGGLYAIAVWKADPSE